LNTYKRRKWKNKILSEERLGAWGLHPTLPILYKDSTDIYILQIKHVNIRCCPFLFVHLFLEIYILSSSRSFLGENLLTIMGMEMNFLHHITLHQSYTKTHRVWDPCMWAADSKRALSRACLVLLMERKDTLNIYCCRSDLCVDLWFSWK
jgi:hypothetical protein